MSYKILVVDDDKNNRELLASLLKKVPECEIILAKNGKEAIKMACQEVPGIILMDWKMPEMDGLQATRIIKEDPKTKNIPILIVTAFSSSENLCNAFDAGANDYIKKPIDKIELLSRVRAFLAYHDSLLKLQKQKEEIEEQRKLIEEEKEKSDNLLNSLFPKEVAWQLRSKRKATPRHYKQVSVMFTDFKKFSRLCQDLTPQEIVNILDYYIGIFDDIVQAHYIEKIKTIGDAYMCVGGLPLRNKSHPIDTVLAGLQIQKFMNNLNNQKVLKGLPVWELRVGIHTGDVVAGVVGKTKFAYDIWGKNVNIASRMEQNGHVGEVNISETTYKLIKNYFDCRYRGKIEAKNIGKIDMYILQGLKKEYAADKERSEPNIEFQKILSRF